MHHRLYLGLFFTQVVGYDISETMIDLAKSKGIPNGEFAVRDCRYLDTPEKLFDVVVTNYAMQVSKVSWTQ